MSCRWWIKGVRKFRTLKKTVHRHNQDGVTFSWDAWGKEISEVRGLNPGDKIWVPYNSTWSTIKEVRFEWSPVQRRTIKPDLIERDEEIKYGRVLGEYVSFFVIETESGHWVYDSPSHMKEWCSDYGKDD
jgi:hypothetical protein